MWTPDQMATRTADLAGISVSAEALGDLEQAPLAAVVDLDFCTGAFVSPTGLVATAYHCVADALQFASRRGENLVEQGFHAHTLAEERWAGPGLSARLTLGMRDVTDQALAGTRRLHGSARQARLESNVRSIVRRCEGGRGIRCEVRPFDHGAIYQLITQRELTDVRLVYAPPRSVGYFGGDADNWQWPRHSGDFAFLRVYAGKSNQPHEHHAQNLPYAPDAHLTVAARGPRPGELVVVPGYPASTYRWLTAAEFEYTREEKYPREIETIRAVLHILDDLSAQDEEIAAAVAARSLGLRNQLQYLEGNLAAFQRLDASTRKWDFERQLALWIVADAERAATWGHVIDTIHRLQAEASATAARDHVVEEMVAQSDLLDIAMRLYELGVELDKPGHARASSKRRADLRALEARLDTVDASFDAEVDRSVLGHFLAQALALPPGLRVPELDLWFAELPQAVTPTATAQLTLQRLYAPDNFLADADQRRALMQVGATTLAQSDNPWFDLASALYPFLERQRDAEDRRAAEWQQIRPAYLAAVQAYLRQDTARADAGLYYHDANGTLRVSIGRVEGYFPRDGLVASARSRLQGITEKSRNAEYEAPFSLMTAIRRGDHGPYGDPEIDSVPVNYLSTADTTLGHSGSPTLNAAGEWVGVLFDGNYESLATDWIFEERLTRSIHTDSAYVLWYLDAVAGADALLEELGHPPQLVATGGPSIETAAAD